MLKKIKFQIVYKNKIHFYKEKTKMFRMYKKNKNAIFLMLTPEYGNVGDHLIAENEKNFIYDNFPNIKLIEISMQHYIFDSKNVDDLIDESDLILITGGGFIGDTWPINSSLIDKIIERHNNKRIIILPQTVYFANEHKKELWNKKYEKYSNLRIFLREKRSIVNISDNIDKHFMPDFGLYCGNNKFSCDRNKILFCIRDDIEAEEGVDKAIEKVKYIIHSKGYTIDYLSTILKPEELLIDNRENVLNIYKTIFSSARLVITDRLHGMIFAIVTGTPCLAFDNITHKISGVFDVISEIPYVKIASDLEQIDTLIEYLLTIKLSDYDKGKVLFEGKSINCYYDLLKKDIKEWIK